MARLLLDARSRPFLNSDAGLVVTSAAIVERAVAAAPARLPQSWQVGDRDAESGGGLEVAVVRTRAAFDALESEWNDLFDRAGRSTQLFQTFNWCWHWCNHFLEPDGQRQRGPTLAIVTGRRHGRLVMVCPLVLQRYAAMTTLGWLGEPVSQYGDVLIDPAADKPELLARAWEIICVEIRPDLVRLRKVRADAEIAALLARLGSVRSEKCEAPYLDLGGAPTFAAYEQRFSTKARRNRRRLLRRLEESGPVGVATIAGGVEARTAAAAALRMKSAWLAARNLVSPALSNSRTLAFFQDVAEALVRPAGCRVSVMTANGEAVAAQITVECKRRLAMHLITYDLAHEKSGVGVLHMEGAIRTAFEAGIGTIDLLAPKAAYKMDWADATIEVADHAVALSWKGRVFARVLVSVRGRLKAVIERPSGRFGRLVGAGVATVGSRLAAYRA